MTKTPKAYRDDLAKDLWAKRTDVNDKIKRLSVNPDFLQAQAINVLKDVLYKELDDARATEEYKDAKSKKQTLSGKQKDVKKQEDVVAEQKKLLGDKEAELATMSEEYGEKIEKKSEKKESGEITKAQLLNKPNMTVKDKEGMQKAIDYLVEKKMDTSENLKKLDAIVYTSEYIEIGGVKRARKDITAKPNGENIFQHNNVTYFQRSKDMIKEQNDLLAKQGMEIPLDSSYEASMRALPGNYDDADYDTYHMVHVKKSYEGGNILAFITDMSRDGDCNNDGKLDSKGEYGYRWSASDVWSGVPGDKHRAPGAFCFNRNDGIIRGLHSYYACPIRPILK